MDAFQSLRVFVVDDDADTTGSTSLLIGLLGHTASFANSAKDALTIAPGWNPDVFLIDLAMPKFDGLELARSFRLLPQFAKTPLVAVTGYVDAKHRGLAADAGFDGFLGKPFSLSELTILFGRIRSRISDTNSLVEQTRDVAEATRVLTRKAQEGLTEYRRNREPPTFKELIGQFETSHVLAGRIKKILGAKQFGFIQSPGRPDTLFFASNVADGQFDSLSEGQEVEFVLRTKSSRARSVKPK